MTEREDTIEEIERVLKLTHENSITVAITRSTAKRAVSMLKEREPKPITIATNEYGSKSYYCPNCKRRSWGLFLYNNYCYNCGQALNWEGDWK